MQTVRNCIHSSTDDFLRDFIPGFEKGSLPVINVLVRLLAGFLKNGPQRKIQRIYVWQWRGPSFVQKAWIFLSQPLLYHSAGVTWCTILGERPVAFPKLLLRPGQHDSLQDVLHIVFAVHLDFRLHKHQGGLGVPARSCLHHDRGGFLPVEGRSGLYGQGGHVPGYHSVILMVKLGEILLVCEHRISQHAILVLAQEIFAFQLFLALWGLREEMAMPQLLTLRSSLRSLLIFVRLTPCCRAKSVWHRCGFLRIFSQMHLMSSGVLWDLGCPLLGRSWLVSSSLKWHSVSVTKVLDTWNCFKTSLISLFDFSSSWSLMTILKCSELSHACFLHHSMFVDVLSKIFLGKGNISLTLLLLLLTVSDTENSAGEFIANPVVSYFCR